MASVVASIVADVFNPISYPAPTLLFSFCCCLLRWLRDLWWWWWRVLVRWMPSRRPICWRSWLHSVSGSKEAMMLDFIKVYPLSIGWPSVVMEDWGYDDSRLQWREVFNKPRVLQVHWKPENSLAGWHLGHWIQVDCIFLGFNLICSQDWIERQLWNRNIHNKESEPYPVKLEARTPLLWQKLTPENLHWRIQGKPEGNLLWGSSLRIIQGFTF